MSNRPLARSSTSGAGAVLVLAMWLLLIIGLLLLGLNRVTAVNRAQSHGELQRVQARWLARAGVEKALDILSLDVTAEDGPLDLWYNDPDDFDHVPLADGYTYTVAAADPNDTTQVRYGLTDETGKINVNFVNANVLANIKGINEELVDCILDWRDSNEQVRPGGAERGYYSQLDYPYEIRNGHFRTQREMLLVRGMNNASFFGDATHPPLADLTTVWSYDPLGLPDGRTKVYLRRTNADDLINRYSFTQALADQVVQFGRNANSVFDLVNLKGDSNHNNNRNGNNSSNTAVQPGQLNDISLQWVADHIEELSTANNQNQRTAKININTAPRAVLEALPGMNAQTADNIISARQEASGFTNVGELLSRGLVSDAAFRRIGDTLTVRGEVLKVVSVGRTPDGVTATIEAVIDRGQTTPVFLYWHQSE